MRITRLLLIALVATAATQAFAEPRHDGRYEMTRLPPSHDNAGRKVLILDKQTGAVWTWSAPATVESAGRLYPAVTEGSFARVLHVDRAPDR